MEEVDVATGRPSFRDALVDLDADWYKGSNAEDNMEDRDDNCEQTSLERAQMVASRDREKRTPALEGTMERSSSSKITWQNGGISGVVPTDATCIEIAGEV